MEVGFSIINCMIGTDEVALPVGGMARGGDLRLSLAAGVVSGG